MYRHELPGTVRLTWRWVARRSDRRFDERTVQACRRAGWVSLTRGGPRPNAPGHFSRLQLMLGGHLLPDTLAITAVAP